MDSEEMNKTLKRSMNSLELLMEISLYTESDAIIKVSICLLLNINEPQESELIMEILLFIFTSTKWDTVYMYGW